MKSIRDINAFNMIYFPGGTLGLFAGASLISVVEVVFWIFKAFYELFANQRIKVFMANSFRQ